MSTAPFFYDERRLPGEAIALVMYGELDQDTAGVARKAIAKMVEQHSGPLVIDVGCLLVTDTVGLAVLLKARHSYGAALINLSPALEEAAAKADDTGRFARDETIGRDSARA